MTHSHSLKNISKLILLSQKYLKTHSLKTPRTLTDDGKWSFAAKYVLENYTKGDYSVNMCKIQQRETTLLITEN